MNSKELIKQDAAPLLEILNLERPGNHGPCRFCGSKDAMSVFCDGRNWAFKCHSCDVKGDVFHALALVEGISDGEAIKRLTGNAPPDTRPRFTFKPTAPKEPFTPVPDAAKVFKLFAPAFNFVLEGRAAARLKFRGIHSFSWFEQHPVLGFIDRLNVPGRTYPLVNSWLILVTDSQWNYLALKVHREKPHTGPKGFWLRVGTEPPEEPKHGVATFWPPPECFELNETLFLCPGELKAAAVIGDGLNATSPTDGESHKWTPQQIDRFRNRDVFILFDDDAAGHEFRDNTIAALQSTAVELRADTLRDEK